MRLQIKAHPKSKKEAVKEKGENFYEVWVREAPQHGKANEAIREALAQHFGISKSSVCIISGLTSKNKWVEVSWQGKSIIKNNCQDDLFKTSGGKNG